MHCFIYKIKVCVLVTLVSILLFSCKKSNTVIPANVSNNVCFNSEIRPIFKTYCATAYCHSPYTNAGGIRLDSFNYIMSGGIIPGDTAASLIYSILSRTDGTQMPKIPYSTPLPDTLKSLISRWILQGAQNNTECEHCDSTQFHYKADIKPLIQLKCGGCHGGATPSGGLLLGGHYNDSSAISGIGPMDVLNDIMYMPNAVPMPPQTELGKLTDCEISKIRKWIQAGMPNN